MLFNDVPLRTRRALSSYTSYSDSTLLVLNRTSLNSVNGSLMGFVNSFMNSISLENCFV